MPNETCRIPVHLQAETRDGGSRLFDIGTTHVDLAPWAMTVDTETLKTVLQRQDKLEDLIGRYVAPDHSGPFFVDIDDARDTVCAFLDAPSVREIEPAHTENARQRTSFYDNTPELQNRTFQIDMVVAGESHGGQPRFQAVHLDVDADDLATNRHHEMAKDAARQSDFTPKVAFDETDVPASLMTSVMTDHDPDPAREARLRRMRDGEDPVASPDLPTAPTPRPQR